MNKFRESVLFVGTFTCNTYELINKLIKIEKIKFVEKEKKGSFEKNFFRGKIR